MPAPRVVLIGPPGSGKSSVGRVLAASWSIGRRDTDDDVEAAAGKTVADVFLEHGEAEFRRLEREAVATALVEHDGVLSLGGGAILDAQTQRLLRDYVAGGGQVVFLDVSLSKAAPRVGLNKSRPLLVGNPRQRWQALMDQRRPVYTELATVTVDTDSLSPEQVAEVIEGMEAHA